MPPQVPENGKKKENERPKNWMQYTGMGMQMLAIILVGVALGRWLDSPDKFPIYTLVLSLLAVFASMYYMIKDLIK